MEAKIDFSGHLCQNRRTLPSVRPRQPANDLHALELQPEFPARRNGEPLLEELRPALRTF